MNYDALQKDYYAKQVERVEVLRCKIVERGDAATVGRVIPEDDDLVLGTGRRLNMAVMFIDLCRFSGRAAESLSDQDMLLRVLNLFFTEMVRLAEDYGGTVEKNTGDGLMAYFEDRGGTPAEDGCKRAVACALTMMHANMNLINPIITGSGSEAIQFRVCIDYGPVTIARLGAAGRFGALVAVGTTSNVASKMLADAGPGEILLGENVVKRLPSAWSGWWSLKKADTGWLYTSSNTPYRFFLYTGRWKNPL